MAKATTISKKERALRQAVRPGFEDPVKAAYDYVCWLELQGRIDEAIFLLDVALREGPDFGLGELRSVSLLDDLIAKWGKLNKKAKREALGGGAVYNEGLASRYKADWQKVFAEMDAMRKQAKAGD
jgi:hypothetical protein